MQPYPGATGRSYRVPIVVLGVLLFLLVGGIVVVLSARAGGRSPCSVGEWAVDSYQQAVRVPAVGQTLTFSGGAGTVLRLRSDGTGETDYGTGVKFVSEAPGGRAVRIEAAGVVHFRYQLGTDTILVTPAGTDATSRLFIADTAYGAETQFSDETVGTSYSLTCRDDSLRQDDGRRVVDYRRR